MSRREMAVRAVLVTLVLIASFLAVFAVIPEKTAAYRTRGQIVIDGDSNFTLANGVTSGDGTSGHPFVIEGWEIDDSYGPAVHVIHTTAYFIVRNVKVQIGTIYLEVCRNATVESCSVSGWSTGICIWFGQSVSVLQNNLASNSDYGVEARGTSELTITGNLLSGGMWGVFLDSCQNAKVYHNDFLGNGVYAFDNRGSENTWDNGYAGGGNWWSSYSGTDTKSGPLQDQAGSDGIGDTPYAIDSDSSDRYPLMSQQIIPEFKEVALPMVAVIGIFMLCEIVHGKRAT